MRTPLYTGHFTRSQGVHNRGVPLYMLLGIEHPVGMSAEFLSNKIKVGNHRSSYITMFLFVMKGCTVD